MFSVVLPTHNRSELLHRAIRSVLSQVYQNYELIIIDDGSTDNTQEVVQSFDKQRIVYLHHDKPQGVSAARNTGIRKARGEWVCFLDDDDEYLPDFLVRTREALSQSHSRVGFSWCGVQFMGGTPDNEYLIEERTNLADSSADNRGEMAYLSIGTGFGLTVKRSCFDKVGLFDEKLYSVVDTDILFRLGANYDFVVIPEFLIKCYSHQGTQLTDISSRRAESLDRVIEKNFHFFKHSKKHILSFYKRSASLHYLLGNKKQGRRRVAQMISVNPFRWRSWKSMVCFEIFGTEQIGIKQKLGLK